MEEVVSVDVDVAARPKRPFLKRGEGTTRRIYAARYKDEAKKKREENQQKAFEREEMRRQMPPTADADRFVDLKDPNLKTFQREESDAEDLLGLENDLVGFSFDCARSSPKASVVNPFAKDGDVEEFGADGRCQIVSDARGEDVAVAEAKRERESQWLEMQRRYEDQQWTEALELQEFEELERKIVDETRSKIEDAEGCLRKKQVTFEERDPEEDHQQTPSTSGKNDKRSGVEEGRSPSIQGSVYQKGRGRSQKGFQRLKSMSSTRSTKTTLPKCTSTTARTKDSVKSAKEVSTSRKNASPSSCLKYGSDTQTTDLQRGEIVVDSSFLDRLVEKDFCQDGDPVFYDEEENKRDSILEEKLKLQSMKEDLENEKKQWEEKQTKVVAQFEATKIEEMKKIKKERRVLDQQSKALLKLPNKKERSEIESLEAALEAERKESRSKEARHKLTVERLKDQIHDLQVNKQELQEEVKWYEELQLKQTEAQGKESKSVATSPTSTVDSGTQTVATHETQQSYQSTHAVSSCLNQLEDAREAFAFKDKWNVQLENPFYSETPVPEDAPGQSAAEHQSPQDNSRQCTVASPMHPSYATGASFCYPNSDHPGGGTLFRRNEPVLEWNRGAQSQSFGYLAPDCSAWSGSNMATRSTSDAPPSFSHRFVPENIPQPSASSLLFNNTSAAFGMPDPAHCGQAFAYAPRDISRSVCASIPTEHLYQAPTWPTQKSGFAHVLQSGQTIPSFLPSTSYSTGPTEPLPYPSQCAVPANLTTHDRMPITSTIQCEPMLRKEENRPLSEFQRASASRSHQQANRSPDIGFNDSSWEKQNEDRRKSVSDAGQALDSCQSRVKETKLPPVQRSSSESKEAVRTATFNNGTVKQTYPDERVVVWFANGDVKHVHPGGRVEYFYSDLNTWQVTHSTGIDVFYFDIGQVEAHKANGEKHIIFPDGTFRVVLADGSEHDATDQEVTPEIRNPKPEIPPNRPDRKPQKRMNRKT